MVYSNTQLQKAALLFEFLATGEPIQKADIAVGFGHFEAKNSANCGKLS